MVHVRKQITHTVRQSIFSSDEFSRFIETVRPKIGCSVCVCICLCARLLTSPVHVNVKRVRDSDSQRVDDSVFIIEKAVKQRPTMQTKLQEQQ